MVSDFLVLGAAAVYSFFWPTIAVYEEQNDIIRGQAGSFLSASMFRCTLNSDISGLHVRRETNSQKDWMEGYIICLSSQIEIIELFHQSGLLH